jgi:hypothetical protein
MAFQFIVHCVFKNGDTLLVMRAEADGNDVFFDIARMYENRPHYRCTLIIRDGGKTTTKILKEATQPL